MAAADGAPAMAIRTIATIIIPPQVGIIPPAVMVLAVVIGIQAGKGVQARMQAMAGGSPPPQSIIAPVSATAGAPSMAIRLIATINDPPQVGTVPPAVVVVIVVVGVGKGAQARTQAMA